MSTRRRTLGVTGATGTLGAAWLAHVLAHRPDWRAIALVRQPAQAEQRLRALSAGIRRRITLVRADLAQLHFSAATLDQLRRVNAGWWHFAARINLAADDATAAGAHAVNDRGTHDLLEVLRHIACAAPFYHVSTAYVAGQQTGSIAEQVGDDTVRFHNPYEQSKAAAEKHVWRYLLEGRSGAILRPSVVVNAEAPDTRGSLPALFARAVFAAASAREPALHVDLAPTARINLVTREWVIQAVAALTGRESAPQVYHLTAPADSGIMPLARAITSAIPGLRLIFPPDAVPETNAASRFLTRTLGNARAYFAAGVTFDRRNLERALPPLLARESCDLAALVRRHLELAGGNPFVGRVPALCGRLS